jgi:hypothetical protein
MPSSSHPHIISHLALVRANERRTGTIHLRSQLRQPRGLAFGPDGCLYVAEGGRGGTATTVGDCPQIPPPVGPNTGGMTARISKIGPNGVRTTVAAGLPSSQSTERSGGLVSGVADVAFVGGVLFALVSGAGCSHGLAGTANGIYRIGADGSAHLLADLGAYRATTTVANPDPPGGMGGPRCDLRVSTKSTQSRGYASGDLTRMSGATPGFVGSL